MVFKFFFSGITLFFLYKNNKIIFCFFSLLSIGLTTYAHVCFEICEALLIVNVLIFLLFFTKHLKNIATVYLIFFMGMTALNLSLIFINIESAALTYYFPKISNLGFLFMSLSSVLIILAYEDNALKKTTWFVCVLLFLLFTYLEILFVQILSYKIVSIFLSGLLVACIFSLYNAYLFSKKTTTDLSLQKKLKERLSLILNGSPLAIFLINSQGKIIFFNEKALSLTGYVSEELYNNSMDVLVPKRERGNHQWKVRDFFSNPQKRKMGTGLDLYLLTKKGRKILVDIDLLPMDVGDEKCVMCSVMDLSKQRKYKLKIKEQSSNTKLLLDIANMINDGVDFHDCLKTSIYKVCKHLNFDIGHLYSINETNKEELSSSGIWYFKNHKKSVDFVKSTVEMSFSKGDGIVGRVWRDGNLLWFDDISKEKNFFRNNLTGEKRVKGAVFIPIFSGKELAAVIELYSFKNQRKNIDLISMCELLGQQLGRVFERKRSKLNNEWLENHDEVTLLPNRKHLNVELARALTKAKTSDYNFALLYLDLDNFKKINDSLGHLMGNKFLKEISSRLCSYVLGVNYIARIGGDEFIIITDKLDKPEDTALIAKGIISLFNNSFDVEGHKVNFSVSIGIAVYPFSGKDKSKLIRNSDIAMIRSKELGKNQYQFYSKDLKDQHTRALKIESGLKEALCNNELFLVYQPQIDLRHKMVVGFEVLLRWNSPRLGLVSPVEFIPKAEEMGLIHEIGSWVAKQACLQFNEWKQTFKLLNINPKLSVNLSVIQLSNDSLIENIKSLLIEFNYPPSTLVFELTESFLLDKIEKSKKILNDISELGVGLAIDDFGTGYSSFGYLKALPFNYLKIDRSFVQELQCEKHDRSIIKAIIHLAEVLDLIIVAEGIETQEQLHYFDKYDKTLSQKPIIIQGYIYSRPLSVADIPNFLESFDRSSGAEY